LYPDDPLVEIVAKVRGSVAEELRVRAAADYRSVSSLVRIIIDKALQEET
jgi:plasmid stability protein